MANMIERLRADREAAQSKGSSGFLKLPQEDCEIKIRVLPAVNYFSANGKVNKEADLFYKRFGVHWINGKRFLCPKVEGDDCPICETVNELYASGTEEDVAIAKDIRMKKRHWVNIVELNEDGTYATTPKVYEFGVKLFDTMLDYCLDEDYDNISDPDVGYDFKIIKKKKDGFPNYDSSKPVKTSTAIDATALKDLLGKATDIHESIEKQMQTYDQIKAGLDLTDVPETELHESTDVNQDDLLKQLNSKLGD